MLVPHLFFRFSQSTPLIGVQQFLAPSDILFLLGWLWLVHL